MPSSSTRRAAAPCSRASFSGASASSRKRRRRRSTSSARMWRPRAATTSRSLATRSMPTPRRSSARSASSRRPSGSCARSTSSASSGASTRRAPTRARSIRSCPRRRTTWSASRPSSATCTTCSSASSRSGASAASRGRTAELFSGAFWSAAKALELGLIDGISDVRTKMREVHGDKVRLRVVPLERGWLPLAAQASALARWMGGRRACPGSCICRRSGVGYRGTGHLVALRALRKGGLSHAATHRRIRRRRRNLCRPQVACQGTREPSARGGAPSREIKRRAEKGRVPKDLGTLEYDPESGVYKPRRGVEPDR